MLEFRFIPFIHFLYTERFSARPWDCSYLLHPPKIPMEGGGKGGFPAELLRNSSLEERKYIISGINRLEKKNNELERKILRLG